MCHLTTIVSGALSLGVFAGVISGIFYVIFVALKWAGKVRVSLETESLRKRSEDESTDGVQSSNSGLITETSIDSKQSLSGTHRNGRVSDGTEIQLNRDLKRRSKNWCDEKEISPNEEANAANHVQIRERIEKLVEKLVGGSLDGVSVGRLSEDESYLGMFSEHHDALCQGLARLGVALHYSTFNEKDNSELSETAHSALKSLIGKIVCEAIKLPDFKEALNTQNTAKEVENENDFLNKSYEDILATAILNKVIEQCQGEKRYNKIKQTKVSKTGIKRARNKGVNRIDKGEDDDIICNSDWSDTSRSDQLSLTIEEHIEEITTTYENSDEEKNEDINVVRAIPFPESGRIIRNGVEEYGENCDEERSTMTEMIPSNSSWEENWLFQKKRLRSRPNAHHPVPVPMLVPNPSQVYRALIGGIDADDLSDMSECSDSVLEDVVLAGDIEVPDSEKGSEPLLLGDNGDQVEENNIVVSESPVSSNSECSCPSLSQKERDISVDYDCLTKFELEALNPPLPRPRSMDNKPTEKEPPKCSIAEREKEKWNHPIEMANNPYSAQNLTKRDQSSKKEYFRTGSHSESCVDFPSDLPIAEEPKNYAIYSRDYYIKASRCPTGDPNVRLTSVNPSFESSVENFTVDEEKSCESVPVAEGKKVNESNSGMRAVEYWEADSLKQGVPEEVKIITPSVKELTKKFSKGLEKYTEKQASPSASQTSADNQKQRPLSMQYLSASEEPLSSSSDTNLNINNSVKLTSKNNELSHSSSSITEEAPYERKEPKLENGTNEDQRAVSLGLVTKFGGKEVHSLTARSISKEFRDELKNNTSKKPFPKIDRGSSGEFDQGEIASELNGKRSPTPPIDMQSKKKFWEDLISNAQK